MLHTRGLSSSFPGSLPGVGRGRHRPPRGLSPIRDSWNEPREYKAASWSGPWPTRRRKHREDGRDHPGFRGFAAHRRAERSSWRTARRQRVGRSGTRMKGILSGGKESGLGLPKGAALAVAPSAGLRASRRPVRRRSDRRRQSDRVRRLRRAAGPISRQGRL